MKVRPFLSLLSALLWVCRCTRYDIAVSLCILSRASTLPAPEHWHALIHIIKYLLNTIKVGIVYRRTEYRALICYCDASHANDPITMRSIGGHMVTLGGNLLDWSARHQGQVALHSGESESIQASSVGATHLLYWLQLINQTELTRPNAELLLDSTTAETLLSNPVHTTTMRHINTRLFFTREHYRANSFHIGHISGTINPSDMLTKILSGERINVLRQQLRLRGGDENSADSSTRRNSHAHAAAHLARASSFGSSSPNIF